MDEQAKDGSRRPRAATRKDTPSLVVRPPIVYLCSILLGLVLHWFSPAEVFPHPVEALGGGSFIFVAIVLFALSVQEFRRAATPVRRTKPTSVVVKTGPYRFSRNPIYLAFTLFQIGVAIWVNSAWVLGTLIPTLVLMAYGVIAREETYLTKNFGAEYLQYKASVRRWL